jgi:hypothetical protein
MQEICGFFVYHRHYRKLRLTCVSSDAVRNGPSRWPAVLAVRRGLENLRAEGPYGCSDACLNVARRQAPLLEIPLVIFFGAMEFGGSGNLSDDRAVQVSLVLLLRRLRGGLLLR